MANKYDRAMLIEKLEAKKQKLIDDVAIKNEKAINLWHDWHVIAIEMAEKSIEIAKQQLKDVKAYKMIDYKPGYNNGNSASRGSFTVGGKNYVSEPGLIASADTSTIDRAIAELEMMIEPTVSLQGNNYLKLL